MTFTLRRYFHESAMLRRCVEVIDFCTYRDVRRFDFGRANLPRDARES